MSTGKVVIGAMVGMATGAVLGVLFAPDRGANTRKQLSKKVGMLKETADETVDALGEGFESVKATAVDLGDRVKGAADSLAGVEPLQHIRRT